MFSIIIPTWNNLSFVKLCVESIRKNSKFDHEIILHINDGTDGTLDWAKTENILFTHTKQNAGVCIAVNMAAAKATKDYIVFLNDDMYVCPQWDSFLADEIDAMTSKKFMLSGTLIEPKDYGNPCTVVKDYGVTVEEFKENELLTDLQSLHKADWSGSKWPPTLVHKDMWAITGGYSIEFSPGMSSDDDFPRKMWEAGCRIFKGVGASKIYHFLSKSTGRIKKNDGRRQFLFKWGINQSTFKKLYLKLGEPYQGELTEPVGQKLKAEKARAWVKQKFLH